MMHKVSKTYLGRRLNPNTQMMELIDGSGTSMPVELMPEVNPLSKNVLALNILVYCVEKHKRENDNILFKKVKHEHCR